MNKIVFLIFINLFFSKNLYAQGCQNITANLLSTSPPQQPDGIIRLCQGASVNFIGSGTFSNSGAGATYQWNFGNGDVLNGTNVNYTFNNSGAYVVNLNITDPNNCTNGNSLNLIVQVSTTPVITTSASPDFICVGQTSTLNATIAVTPFEVECTPPVSIETFLPDGNGVSYDSSIEVNCYSAGQTVTAISDIENICLNMEHSFLGDLNIKIICPNGQSMDLHTFNSSASGLSANLGTPWATGPIDSDSDNTTPGTGLLYCFLPTAGLPSLIDGIQSGGIFTSSDGPGTYTDSFVPAGDYSPSESFANLIGCPCNGIWTIEVTDNFPQDNGYIFSWEFNFNPSIPILNLNFTPTIISQGWLPAADLTIVNSTQATVTAVSNGSSCYTYSMTDNFGCTYTEEQCITVGINPTFDPFATYCEGSTIPQLPTISNNSPPITGTWSPAINNTTTTLYTFTPTPGQNCVAPTLTTMTIQITPLEIPSFTQVQAICAGDALNPLPLISNNNIAGIWSPPINNNVTTQYTFTPNVGQCAAIAVMTIAVQDIIPNFQLADGFICLDENGLLVPNRGFLLETGLTNPSFSYAWYLNGNLIPGVPANSSTFYATEIGTYKVVIDNGFCTRESTAVIMAYNAPRITNVTVDRWFEQHVRVMVSVSSTGNYLYRFNNEAWQSSNVFENVPAGPFQVFVKNAEENPCGVDSEMGLVVKYPLFFTPNGDGFNSTWNIVGLESQSKSTINIYDRQGKLVAEIQPNRPGWDGSYNGMPLPSSDYWFSVDYLQNMELKTFKAHFTLKR